VPARRAPARPRARSVARPASRVVHQAEPRSPAALAHLDVSSAEPPRDAEDRYERTLPSARYVGKTIERREQRLLDELLGSPPASP
jgi:hypothetical protein